MRRNAWPTAAPTPATNSCHRRGERPPSLHRSQRPLVQSIANKFNVPMHLDRDDLVQDGMIGLDKAVEKFDWRRGYKFSTYATWWIRQSIQRGLEASATTIRIPGHRSRELRNAAAANTGRLTGELAMIDMLSHLESMDRPLGDGTDTLGAMVRSSDEGPDEAAERNLQRRTDRRAARPPRPDEPVRRGRTVRPARPRSCHVRRHRRRTRRDTAGSASPGGTSHRETPRPRGPDRRLTRRLSFVAPRCASARHGRTGRGCRGRSRRPGASSRRSPPNCAAR